MVTAIEKRADDVTRRIIMGPTWCINKDKIVPLLKYQEVAV
jgi:hypothetical protein